MAFTDADCVPEPCWIERLLVHFAQGVVAVGGTYGIANPQSLLARMIHEEIAVRHDRLGEEVDFLGSFNVACLREAFEAAGGFDESFPTASAEDNDLAYRLGDAGGVLRFAKDAVVRHFHPTQLAAYLRTQMRHGYWRMKLYAKHPGRARGDKYAGIADMLAPPLLLLIVAACLVSAGCALWLATFKILGIAVAPACMYVAMRIPLPIQMARNARDPKMLGFLPVMFLRDLARSCGMVAGLWTFALLKRGRA